jgi:type VI secretion system secreted protein Hcp
MPIYMQIQGIDGPVDYEGPQGWFELRSLQFGSPRASTATPSGQDKAPRISEITATKSYDSASSALFRESLQGNPKDVTIVFVRPGDSGSPEEYLRIKLKGALIGSYSLSGGDDRPIETFSLNFEEITFKTGSPAHASLMMRPQDWGSIQATALFNQDAEATA